MLEENILVVLKLIYNAENQSLHKDEIKNKANLGEINYDYLIAKIEEEGFIETEETPDLYFLTAGGYQVVEEGVYTPEPVYDHTKYKTAKVEMPIPKPNSPKDKRFRLIVILALITFISIIAYLISIEDNKQKILPAELEVPSEMINYIDSVENDLGGFY